MTTSTEAQRLSSQISAFLQRHQTTISEIGSQLSNIFEAACYVVFAGYYEQAGYRLRADNLLDGRFRFRYSTAGLPWNFSYFALLSAESTGDDDEVLFEVRHNQKVASAWVQPGQQAADQALFALDVVVVEAGALPHLPKGHRRGHHQDWAANEAVLTFAEAKNLTAYPMLLAQFLGVVHEVKPEFLGIAGRPLPAAFWAGNHPPPTLMTASHLTRGTKNVLRSFEARSFVLAVVDNVLSLPHRLLVKKLDNAVCALTSYAVSQATMDARDDT